MIITSKGLQYHDDINNVHTSVQYKPLAWLGGNEYNAKISEEKVACCWEKGAEGIDGDRRSGQVYYVLASVVLAEAFLFTGATNA